jgi:hypothetical protein
VPFSAVYRLCEAKPSGPDREGRGIEDIETPIQAAYLLAAIDA